MKRSLKKATGSIFQYITNKCGSVMPLAALAIPMVMGMAGIGVDAGMWAMDKRNLQTAADAAAMAGAWEVLNDLENNADAAALQEAINNGYDQAADGVFELVIEEDADGNTVVTANITQAAEVYLAKLVYQEGITINVTATATVNAEPGEFCILSLDPTADAAISVAGNATIESETCGLAVNSDSPSALDLQGSVTVDVQDLTIVGDYETGNSSTLNYGTINTNADPVVDPYADLAVPAFLGCGAFPNGPQPSVDVNDQADADAIDPALNGGITVICGDLDVNTNGTVEFHPGVYIIDGGDFDVAGNGIINGDGVSFVFTDSSGNGYGTIDVTGGSTITFSGPDEGALMEGVVFYQDRDAPTNGNCGGMTGNSSFNIDGAIYFPATCLEFGGTNNAGGANICTRIIARTVALQGNPAIANDCSGSAVEDITSDVDNSVRLIN